MKESLKSSAVVFLVSFLAQVALAAVPAANSGGLPIPTRQPNAPDAPVLTPVAPNTGEMAQINAAFKKLISDGDATAKTAFDKYANFNPLTNNGYNPPATADGDFVIGPNYIPAPEQTARPDVPHGTVSAFIMNSEDSKIFPGIGKEVPFGDLDPNNPKTVLIPSVHPMAYKRTITVYVPAQYVPGTFAPFMVTADGPRVDPNQTNSPARPAEATVLDNLIAQHRVPVMIMIMIQNGGYDAQGSERGLEYDTMSGKYAEFVETEVLPQVEQKYNVKLTQDPEGRATMGGSSGGSCALIMAWYHPEWYHRVLTYSGTYVNQQWPFNPDIPDGAWAFHEHLIPESAPKPLRIWLEVGDRDLYFPNIMRDGMHDWTLANERMATVLKAKGYHYQFLFAQNAGHTDGNVKQQTLPEALEWLWEGYPKDAPPQK